jgi:hypothetical protein
MNIFEEIFWPQFIQLEYIKPLPLNEQIKQYNQYVYDLSINRQNWLNYQNKGPFAFAEETEGYLLQEDLFDLLQEDGSKIIIT